MCVDVSKRCDLSVLNMPSIYLSVLNTAADLSVLNMSR